MKHKYFLAMIFKILVLTLIFISAYYFLFLRPKLALPKAFLDAERSLYTHYYTLIQNRLAFTQITKLDLKSATFADSKDEMLAKLQTTNEQGLKALADQKKPKLIKGPPSNALNFLNDDLAQAQTMLFEKNKKIYKDQKNIITKLVALDQTISDLFTYDPETDIGSLTQKDKEETLERIANAKNGLSKIKNDISSLDQNNGQIKTLISGIDKSLALLTQLEENLSYKTYQDSQNIKNSLYNQFGEVKKQAFDAELSVIRSDESVKLLTEEANLILEYEFWLDKIKGFQKSS